MSESFPSLRDLLPFLSPPFHHGCLWDKDGALGFHNPSCLSFLLISYKLWYRYLKARRAQVKHRCVTDPAYEDVNNCHERAFVFMHKVGIWRGVCGRASALLGTVSPVRCKQASTPSSQCSNKTKVFHGLGELRSLLGFFTEPGHRAWVAGRGLPAALVP